MMKEEELSITVRQNVSKKQYLERKNSDPLMEFEDDCAFLNMCCFYIWYSFTFVMVVVSILLIGVYWASLESLSELIPLPLDTALNEYLAKNAYATTSTPQCKILGFNACAGGYLDNKLRFQLSN